MAPGRSLCRRSKSHVKSEYRRFADVGWGKRGDDYDDDDDDNDDDDEDDDEDDDDGEEESCGRSGGSYATRYAVYLPLMPSVHWMGSETVTWATEEESSSSAWTRGSSCCCA
jgi:hypothetical protein